jgi:NTP pyrophosphatase (non-canonical NTP hydrolase)
MIETLRNIEKWADDRRLLSPELSFKQFTKGVEEMGEIANVLCKNKPKEELADGIGDVAVVLTILAAQNGLRFEDCLTQAYNEIKDRTGTNVNGVFIKNE